MSPVLNLLDNCFCCKIQEKKEPTSGFEPLTCSLRMSFECFPPRITQCRDVSFLQVNILFNSPFGIVEYRDMSPLLLTLLLTVLTRSRVDYAPGVIVLSIFSYRRYVYPR